MQYRGAGYENLIVYGYDKNGNITKAGDVTYAYDEAGQLTRVNDPRYGTTVYTYDVGGNIKYVKTYDYTTGELGAVKSTGTYSYDSVWKDKLISYNGQAITYDGAGNPLTYRNGISFTWEMGRQLAGLSTGNKTYTYQYNADGLRIQTSDGTTTTRYTWVDGRLTSQTNGTDTLYFRYDENGNPLAVLYNGTEYYYVTDLQGDIIALLDGQGNCVVEYTYDAWGKVLSKTGSMATSLGSDNPLRYRGYYYDSETGFYYLQSRYYDPATGRFINADDVSYLGASGTALSYNLFAYCENSPVNDVDLTGELSLKAALSQIGNLINKVIGKFGKYLLSLIRYNRAKKLLSFNTTFISTAIDALIAMITNGLIYRGLKTGMKLLLQNKKIRASFVNSMFAFFLNNKIGKIVLWTIARIGFGIAGKPGAIGTVTSGVFKGFLSNILTAKSQILQKASSLISAFSSVGGIIALFLDIMDRKWDDYLTIKV